MKVINFVLAAVLLVISYSASSASVETYQFSKVEYETRFQQLNKILRCPKCQNQNLADSNSMISQDLRKEVFRLLEEGRSDDQIIEFMVMRYGDFVLYKPKFDNVTYFLWLGPIGFALLGGLILFVVVIRQRGKASHANATDNEEQLGEQLSSNEQQALDRILSKDND